MNLKEDDFIFIISYLNRIMYSLDHEDYKLAKIQIRECLDTINDISYFNIEKELKSAERLAFAQSGCDHPGLDEFGNFKSMPTGCGYDK